MKPLIPHAFLAAVRGPLQVAVLAYVGAGGLAGVAIVGGIMLSPAGGAVQQAIAPAAELVQNVVPVSLPPMLEIVPPPRGVFPTPPQPTPNVIVVPPVADMAEAGDGVIDSPAATVEPTPTEEPTLQPTVTARPAVIVAPTPPPVSDAEAPAAVVETHAPEPDAPEPTPVPEVPTAAPTRPAVPATVQLRSARDDTQHAATASPPVAIVVPAQSQHAEGEETAAPTHTRATQSVAATATSAPTIAPTQVPTTAPTQALTRVGARTPEVVKPETGPTPTTARTVASSHTSSEKSDRADQGERQDGNGKPAKSDNADKSAKADKGDGSNKSAAADKPNHSNNSNKSDNGGKSDKSDTSSKAARPDNSSAAPTRPAASPSPQRPKSQPTPVPVKEGKHSSQPSQGRSASHGEGD